jgi:hypothetical protein
MAKSQNYRAYLGATPYIANTSPPIRIPIRRNIRGIFMRVSGTLQVTVAGAIVGRGIADILSKIDFVRDGVSIATLTSADLAYANFHRKVQSNIFDIAHATVSVQTPIWEGFLDFANIGGLRPKDSDLESLGHSDILLVPTFAPISALTTATTTVNTLALNLTMLESAEYGLDAHGSTAVEASRPTYIRKQNKLFASGNGVLAPILLPRNRLLDGLWFDCRNTASGLAAAGIANIAVKVGTDYLFNMPGQDIIDLNWNEQQFQQALGIYIADLGGADLSARKITDCLDLYFHKEDVYLEITTNQAANVLIGQSYFEKGR